MSFQKQSGEKLESFENVVNNKRIMNRLNELYENCEKVKKIFKNLMTFQT